jgi:multiple sugar transport system permease protein
MNIDSAKLKPISGLFRYKDDYLFMLPYLIIFLIFTIIPVIVSIVLSFTYFNVMELPRWAGVNNYFRLFLDDTVFVIAFKNTFLFAIITGPISFLLSLLLAWLVNEFSPKLRALFTLLFYAPSISGSAYLIWQTVFSSDARGWLNSFLISNGLIHYPKDWLFDAHYMFAAAIIIVLWMSLGTGFLSFIAGYQNIDKKLYEAASVDGIRNRWQELWYITLPSMHPQIMFGAVMTITSSFGIGDVLTGIFGFPSVNYGVHTLVHHLQDYGNIRFEMGYASAIATLLFLMMIGLNIVVQKMLRRLGG